MPSKFFEILLDDLPVNEDLVYEKYTPSQYNEMAKSLGDVQSSMDQGKTGKEILATPDSQDPRGLSNTYRHFYNPESGERVKVDFNNSGEFGGYTNGRHRIEAARSAGLTHIPAEVSCPNLEELKTLENQSGSGRDLSQFNPKEEQLELYREEFGLKNSDDNSEQSPSPRGTSEPFASSDTVPQPQGDNTDFRNRLANLRSQHSQPIENEPQTTEKVQP
jgi:hypothetical protein